MNVLVVGSGGREHALAWKAAQSPDVAEVFVAPGNAGTALEPGLTNVNIAVDDFDSLIQFAQNNQVELTIVGPEVPLVAGIRDAFDAAGLRCFGPSQAAAQLEGSKAFTKDFLARHNIPTGTYQTFSAVDEAVAYIKAQGAPIVVKADGLAAGKGVVVAQSEAEAIAAVTDMLSGNAFGEAGHSVVIEEFLVGEEASFICLCDGTDVVPFASSQDHKARDEGDLGPNTGGMGAYSPAPVVSAAVHERTMQEVILPTLRGMVADGHPYQGFLYAGLMIDAHGAPRVIEFNCRFGDPEAQPIMMRLESDLVTACNAVLEHNVAALDLAWDKRVAIGVVMAAGGYPESYAKGAVISGLHDGDSPDDCKTFHAGTALDNNNVVTAGGRVLCVVALGDSVLAAQTRAHERIAEINWTDVYWRRDIGHRAIAREKLLG